MSLHELKPCPFCGGNADKHIDDYGEGKFYVTVRCLKCGAKVSHKGAIEAATEQAVNAWNNRADERKSGFDNAGWEQLLLLFWLLFVEPPRREISINAQTNGKSVNISYDPHDPEAVKEAETWHKALFADGTRFKAVEPVAVKAGDVVAFTEPDKSALDAGFERIRREGYCCPSCGCDSLRHAGEPKRDIMAMERNALENVLAVLNRAATEVSRHSERDKGFHTGVVFAKSLLEAAQHDEETSGSDS